MDVAIQIFPTILFWSALIGGIVLYYSLKKQKRQGIYKQNILNHHNDLIQKFARQKLLGNADDLDRFFDSSAFNSLVKVNMGLTPGIEEVSRNEISATREKCRNESKEIIVQLIDLEVKKQFKNSILSGNPKNFNDCVMIFGYRYPKFSFDSFNLFQELVSQNTQFDFPQEYSIDQLKTMFYEQEEQRKQQILESSHYHWIQKFAERKFSGHQEKGEFKQFFNMLQRKDSKLFGLGDRLDHYKIVQSLINSEVDSLEQKKFIKSILRLNPNDFEGCLEIFCHRYPEPSGKQFRRFQRLVTQNPKFAPPNGESDREDLRRLFEKKKEEIEAEEFERTLKNQDSSSFQRRTVSIEDVDEMEGHDFESFLEKLFTEMGYYAEKTRGSGDQGADLILKKDGLTTVVQAKRSQSKISNKAVQEVLAGEKYYGADRLMVVTNHFFHESAKELAKRGSVELVDRNELRSWISSNPISDREV